MRLFSRSRPRRIALLLLAVAAALAGSTGVAHAEPTSPPSGVEILQNLKSFSQMATVLMIAAHPDDENTNLITYLARGRGYRMGYLSVTRGNGGQNLLGGEFGDELGWIRTQELLAARNLDHGVQFFTRAIDFGYSKTPEETLRIWNQEEVLKDVVRVIRTFRPDVVVTRFSPEQTNTHGHHTASAILGVAAFKVAGDPRILPDVPVWQPKRIMLNGGGGGRGGAGGVSIGVGGTDPVLNQTYAAIAGQSRAMHKSQGFGNAGGGGGGRGGPGAGNPQEGFTLLAGEPATTDIMDGIDTTWARVQGGEPVARLTADAIAAFDTNNPAASVPALLQIKKLAAALPADSVVTERLAKLDRIIADCLGLSVESTVTDADVVPGEQLKVHLTATVKATMPITWNNVTANDGYPVIASTPMVALLAGKAASAEATVPIGTKDPVSQPYWLRQEAEPGIYHVEDLTLIGRPENRPVMPLKYEFEIGGQRLALTDEPVQLIAGTPLPQARRRLNVIAPVSLAFPTEVRLFAGGAPRSMQVEVTAHRQGQTGSVTLKVPAGWKSAPQTQNFSLAKVNDHGVVTFTVTPASASAAGTIAAVATIGTQTFSTSWKEINYDHIPRLLMQPEATTKAVAVDLKIAGKTVGYLPGAGDGVADCLEQMGYAVKELKTEDLTAGGLKGLDAVVIGVRAFNTRSDLAPNSATLKAIFDYAADGGTVVEQYNRPDQLRNTTLTPFPLTLSALRVTDENAKITFLMPQHPVLNLPNKITDADFANWVQERSIYLPQVPGGSPFEAILGAADPGETPPNTALLVAKTGKGYFVYTSLVFFRELPAGNAGAYRLFANLVSLGK